MPANRKKVLVPTMFAQPGMALLEARDDVDLLRYPPDISGSDLLPLLADAAGIVLSLTPFRKQETDASPVLQVVARIGVGYDTVEVPPLTARGIPLMIAGTANSVSVAEHALYLIMTLAKRGAVQDRFVRGSRWADRNTAMPLELAGKTLLVVGFGRIGTRAARRAAAFDMTVLVYDPYVPGETIRAAGYEHVSELDAALPRADFITIHCPKTPETIGMFNAARFARMKRGAGIVNTARGGIIDEPALHEALTSGQLAGAGLDVFDEEPTPADNPLLKLENVVTSPHMAGVTHEAVAAMARVTAENVLSVLDGRPIRDHVVNQEVLG
jgi:D-3-phosphoglycerate dehydrogenase / 2-oxoglutarate reductase